MNPMAKYLEKLIKLKETYSTKQANIKGAGDEFFVSMPYQEYEKILTLAIETLQNRLIPIDSLVAVTPEQTQAIAVHIAQNVELNNQLLKLMRDKT
jgi:predicted ATP-dependent serine protease